MLTEAQTVASISLQQQKIGGNNETMWQWQPNTLVDRGNAVAIYPVRLDGKSERTSGIETKMETTKIILSDSLSVMKIEEFYSLVLQSEQIQIE